MAGGRGEVPAAARTELVRVAGLWAGDFPASAGRVGSGPGEPYTHLALRLDDAHGWSTACPADITDENEERHVAPVLASIDCPACLADGAGLVQVVNRHVAEATWAEERTRSVLAGFLDWAAEEYPHGGAVLAVYAGDTRLHPTRQDERARIVEAFVADRRRIPVVTGGE
ncbi:hypothetical protein [Micromonospora sp. RP3T]|uniref:hypothetical protein n=1 Tax=Micromonospora sp. RP3T TaxID=2135446 RepID=UPI003D724054